MDTIKPYCYSQRLLNPFRGAMNVIELGNADAVTTDGVEWTLYLREGALQGMANDGDMAVEMIDIRFGTWSEKQGLKRAPLLTTMEYDAIQHAGEQLLEVVKRYANKVPFPFRDKYELWLLDKYLDQPLALVDSVCFASDIGRSAQISWTPGLLCQQMFNSGHLQQISGQGRNILNHGVWLMQQVNDASGSRPRVQWFLRNADGSGSVVSSVAIGSAAATRIGADSFPDLMLNREWLDNDVVAVVEDFLGWQAPWLLLLDHITDSTRAWLEPMACKHARRLATHKHLYPRVVDCDRINAALIEAMLRSAKEVPADDNDGYTHHIAGEYV